MKFYEREKFIKKANYEYAADYFDSAEDAACRLEELVDACLTIQAERRAPHLSGEESKLSKTIQRRLSEKQQNRLRELQALRDKEKLSAEGYAELAAITDELEEIHADRMKALLELANLRGTSVAEQMNQIGIKLPDYE